MTHYWGIDLGGTKIECAVLDATQPTKVLARRRRPTEAHKGYVHILDQIVGLVHEVTKETGQRPTSIGFATPGTLDPFTQTMRGCNTVVMNGQPMQADLEARLGVPCFLANDANCFALAEARLGVVPAQFPDAQVVFGVILGTGVGGGLVINGQVRNGKQGIGGEWGHNFLDDSGGECYCGNIGCVEKVISGPNLEKYYTSLTGETATLHEILLANNSATHATLERLHIFFGKGLASIVNVLDPDVIVLGGGVSNVPSLYTEGVERLKKHIFNPKAEACVVKNILGDSAGVFGAALLTK